MFTIKTYIKVEKGIKVFTKRSISKGSVIWEFIEGLDKKITSEDIKDLSLVQRDFVYRYFPKREGVFYSSCDNSIFLNQSITPNCTFKGDVIISLREILTDEELTIDIQE